MKKVAKISLTILCFFLLSVICIILCINALTSNVKLDKNKLINFEQVMVFYDTDLQVAKKQSNGKSITEISLIPSHTKNAFISIEDKRFYKHNGIDYKGLLRATINNIKSFSFKEGASTITQQLIKNTHLTSEKTLKRKLIEIKLAKKLENTYTKEEILEKYLNTIYFGDNCYGITNASHYYFNKEPSQLDINESAMLAGIIKAPTYYSPFNNYEKCVDRKNLVLKQMLNQAYLTEAQYNENVNKTLSLSSQNQESIESNSYFNMAKKQVNQIIKNSPYQIKHLNVYTYLDTQKQSYLENAISENKVNSENGAILLDKNAKVLAYHSSIDDAKRQIGSVIKPLICYAPAIQENKIHLLTKINDEPTDFNGYAPKNYNDKYLGQISCQNALATSSNICAVKVLNYVGVDNAKKYLEKMGFELTKNDNSLCMALGAFENGASLSKIASAYTVFNNNGRYSSPSFIQKITDKKGNVIYSDTTNPKKIFNEDTIDIMNEMLSQTVKSGTAKKLSFANPYLYAKTGTVGNKNGNTDAYSVSYNNEFIIATWLGNKKDNVLPNNITGGNHPTLIAKSIWNNIYTTKVDTKIHSSLSTCECCIDKISYDNENKIELADINAPEKYKIKTIFKKNNLPKSTSTRFSFPTIDKPILSVKQNEIVMQLCLTQYYDLEVYKLKNGKYIKVYDTKNNSKNTFVDKDLDQDVNSYKVIPYYFDGKQKHYGNEVFLEKIKSPTFVGDEWWQD